MKETSAHATLDTELRRLYSLREAIRQATAEEKKLTERLKQELALEDGQEFYLEGIGTAMVRDRATGMMWDSDAIRNLQERHPQEWRKLTELGAVTLKKTVIDVAIQSGNLAGMPEGGHSGSTPTLVFEREK